MPSFQCANHPSEQTFVRCGRCDKPICVRCMVDSPVGKKCRPCAQNRTHQHEATPLQVLFAFGGALAVALPAGWVLQEFRSLFYILSAMYGYAVAEAAFRAGQRSRSTAVQVVTGLAALIGGLVGALVRFPSGMPGETEFGFRMLSEIGPISLIATGIGVFVAVARVRSV